MKTIKTLSAMPYANARIIINNDSIVLQSYQTYVANIKPSIGELIINGIYSRTTGRHLKEFCKEYCGIDNYQLIKHIATEQIIYNYKTGEVIEL